ncbi:MAG: hypothetical protein KJZ91_30490, partial [Myxococcales bacterium]|nr:hypothetical protein [Myxococcales bacterium]
MQPGVGMPASKARSLPRWILLAALLGSGCTTGWVATGPAVVTTEYIDVGVPPGEVVWTVEVFYEELADHGTWIEDPTYGPLFEPYGDDFAPYRDGHWVMTDHGMTWVSEEPFGWACYHYGRWMFDGRWRWLPGTEWAPAWVEWRETEELVTWAPLPPDDGRWTPPRHAWRGARWEGVLDPDRRRHHLDGASLAGVYDRARRVERYGRSPSGRPWAMGPSADRLRARGVDARPTTVPVRDLGRLDDERRRRLETRVDERVRARDQRARGGGDDERGRQRAEQEQRARREREEAERRQREERDRRQRTEQEQRARGEREEAERRQREENDRRQRAEQEQRERQEREAK